jgi:transcriptional regulator with XRE-family HTH domain
MISIVPLEKDTIGARMKAIRAFKCLSQKDVASGIHVSKMTIVNWENDRSTPHIDKVYTIAEFLGVPVSVFFAANFSIAIDPYR